MFSIKLPDGSVREVERGTTPADVAAAIGPGLAKAALAARVNGEVRDLARPFEGDADLALITARDEAEALELARHDYAHVLAEAVQNLFPGTQITFGPATDDGFYYDFAPTAAHGPFTEEELPAIEAEMRRIIRADEALIREEWSREQVRDFFEQQGETFKAEWVMELPADETISMYRSGGWIDLCRGPHLASTGKLDPDAFKLTRVSGAYWRGDQRNPQLSRIYGTGWLNRKQLEAHLVRLEEAAKRDHRKIGQEMDLFHLQPEAHGSVFWHPKGYIIWRQLEAYMRRRLDAAGYDEVKTPQLMDARQWEQSGHWGKYRENMFVVPDEVPGTEDGGPILSGDADLMALKPMNCPATSRSSARASNPIATCRCGSPSSAAATATSRTARCTASCACASSRRTTPISSAARTRSSRRRGLLRPARLVYRDLGFADYAIKLALRPDKRFGTDEMWDKPKAARGGPSNGPRHTAYGWEELPGEGAFYGPSSNSTCRRDRPHLAVRHAAARLRPARAARRLLCRRGRRRAPAGHAAPRDPRHVRALHRHLDRASCRPLPAVAGAGPGGGRDDRLGGRRLCPQVAASLQAAGLRVETDLRNEKINYKVREHSLAKVPYLLVVGKREAEEHWGEGLRQSSVQSA
jgi:threonyl-tRNA synthetase